MRVSFYGATQEVTGSCFLLEVGGRRVLVECGLIQGSSEHERHNRDPFPFEVGGIDAVVLTHAHLDHSGRLPLLVKQGYAGPIFTHRATVDLCSIMLEDAAYLAEKEAQRENRRRKEHGDAEVEPLYAREDARRAQDLFVPIEYGEETAIVDGVRLTLRDAGHILGSAIAQFELSEGGKRRRVVFSGDLGHRGAPILRDPEQVQHADLVVMESTYGDRQHRPWQETWKEMGEILSGARNEKGNILVPAFTVGRTQELLYVFSHHFDEWGLGDWRIFLDSPMAIRATEVYDRHARIYDTRARQWHGERHDAFRLPNLSLSETADDSMQINEIHAGAIIIAGSGMCSGGRIVHHLQRNLWRSNAHVMIVGFQARGTPGRALVDGAKTLRIWGEEIEVKAHIHTVGGLSAHADQENLVQWYRRIEGRPRVVLVHGEAEAMDALQQRMQDELEADVVQATYKQTITL